MNEDRLDRLQQIAGPVSRETFDDLETLVELLLRWNERINLISPSTTAEIWERHLLDSAQVHQYGVGANTWTDLGSGGGFPGLVIATLLKGSGVGSIDLVESNQKKAAFLSAAVARLRLPARIYPNRIERHVTGFPPPDIVTARALAPLPRLLELTSRWLIAGSKALFHKGREYRTEVEESRQHWFFELVEHPSKLEAGAAILEIRELRPRTD